MDRRVLDYLTRKMRDGRRDYRDSRDSRDNRDERDERDYEDGRRGVKGTGRYSRSRDRRDRRDNDYGGDYNDFNDYADEEDYGNKMLYLTKSDMHHWKKNMENVDGTKGEHFDMEEIMKVAEKLGINFHHFSEKEFCLAVNMMYSDYCKVVRKHISPEKELMFYAELAKAFLDDPDGPEPSEKLALYFHCIVNAE